MVFSSQISNFWWKFQDIRGCARSPWSEKAPSSYPDFFGPVTKRRTTVISVED
jgi:hypothetical protein